MSAIQAIGLILRILCMEDDLARDLDHSNVAVVPLKSLPAFEGRGDPLAAFQLQDRVRGSYDSLLTMLETKHAGADL